MLAWKEAKAVRLILTGIIGVAVVFAVNSCKVVKEETGGTKTVADLCLTASDISGWTPSGDACAAAPYGDLFGPINGGADLYIEKGLVEYIFTNMAGTGSKEVQVMGMDMATTEKALVLLEYMKTNEIVDKLALPNYAETAAVISVTGMGTIYKLYAVLDRFYFELTFQGLTNETEAKNTAEGFLAVYKIKI